MCLALNSLHLTLKWNALVNVVDLETAVIQNVKKYQMNTRQLSIWAKDFLETISGAHAHYNSRLDKYGPDIVEWLGNKPGSIVGLQAQMAGHQLGVL